MRPNEARAFQDRFFRLNPSLREPMQLMKLVPNASFFVKDRKARYVLANAFHLGIYNLMREEDLVGKMASDFFPVPLADAYEKRDRDVLEKQERICNELWLLPQIHGIPRWFLANKSPLCDAQGRVIGMAGLMCPTTTPEHQRTCFQELQSAIGYIEENFKEPLSLQQLAAIAGLSVTHFKRRFRHNLNLAPMEYVQSLRLYEAKRWLATSDRSIGEIAALAGYFDQSHFTKRFRKAVGVTPRAYRRRLRTVDPQ